jgi:hypothetical protein
LIILIKLNNEFNKGNEINISFLILTLLPVILSENKLKFINEEITFTPYNEANNKILLAEFNYPVTKIGIITKQGNDKILAPLDSGNNPIVKITLSKDQIDTFLKEIKEYTAEISQITQTQVNYQLHEFYDMDKKLSLTDITLKLVTLSFYFKTEQNDIKKLYMKYSHKVNQAILGYRQIMLNWIEIINKTEKEQKSKNEEAKMEKVVVAREIKNISEFKVAAFAFF